MVRSTFRSFQFCSLLFLCAIVIVPGLLCADDLYVPEDYDTIQDAIDEAADEDTVHVAEGTYIENIDFDGKAITVISEDGPEDTFIDGDGDGSVVTFSSGEGRDSVLEGFTILNGEAAAFGAGIFIEDASPTIRNNHITENLFSGFLGLGSGVYMTDSDALFVDNEVSENSGVETTVGAGMFIIGESAPDILGNVFRDNDAGGLLGLGGGLATASGTEANVVGNIFAFNIASSDGGGVYLEGGGVFERNTLHGNECDEGAAGIGDGSDVPIVNCILWGNDGDQYDADTVEDISYCCIEDGPTEDGNIEEDPLFVLARELDFNLEEDSPCIDAGDPDSDDDPDGTRADMGALYYEQKQDATEFLRGDCNGDGSVTVLSDVIFLLRAYFANGDDLPCLEAGDTNDNDTVSALTDSLYLLRWAFGSGDAPPAPGGSECGVDPDDLDDIDCETPPDCD